jgi:hypothetical protein
MRPRHAFEVTFNQVTGIKDGKAARSAELGHKRPLLSMASENTITRARAK